MANPQVVAKRGQLRTFIQLGGPGATNGLKFAGINAGYVELTGANKPLLGGVDPINIFDPQNAGQYIQAGRMVTAPALPKVTMTIRELQNGAIPLADIIAGCPINLYEVKGACKDLSDFLNGWDGGSVRIYSQGIALDTNPGDRTTFEKDDPLAFEIPLVLNDIYTVAQMGFGEATVGGSVLTNEIVKDVVYGNKQLCGNCGDSYDGSQRIYASAAASTTSPGAKPRVLYSLDGGATWTGITVSSAAVAEDLIAIELVGTYLVVLSKTGGGSSTSAYHYAQIGNTGVPGSWTKVTTGFVSAKPANDIYVASPTEVYFAADGGYIYKATDITAGVSVLNAGNATTNNLLRIDGSPDAIVATGASATVIKSTNGGASWAATTVSPVSGAVNIQALDVLSGVRYWVGTDSGRVFSTNNGGDSWNETFFSGSSSGSVSDIRFATDEVGYFAHDTATPNGRVFSTWNGGNSFTNLSPRLVGIGTYAGSARLAVPSVGRASLLSNNLTVVGTKTAGTQGLLMVGKSSVI